MKSDNKELVRDLVNKIGWDDLLKELELTAFQKYRDGGKSEDMFYCLFMDIHTTRAGYNGRVMELNKKAGFK